LQTPEFRQHEPSCNILCFRWLGGLGPDDARLDSINLELRECWNRSGAGWITSTVLDGRRVLRAVLMNPFTESRHVARLVEGLAGLAPAIEPRLHPQVPSGFSCIARIRFALRRDHRADQILLAR
jgi:glutamate/tyrosine decarboxylase-like PLP-dependent enzyme